MAQLIAAELWVKMRANSEYLEEFRSSWKFKKW